LGELTGEYCFFLGEQKNVEKFLGINLMVADWDENVSSKGKPLNVLSNPLFYLEDN
jgi:hypothetical protein